MNEEVLFEIVWENKNHNFRIYITSGNIYKIESAQ